MDVDKPDIPPPVVFDSVLLALANAEVAIKKDTQQTAQQNGSHEQVFVLRASHKFAKADSQRIHALASFSEDPKLDKIVHPQMGITPTVTASMRVQRRSYTSSQQIHNLSIHDSTNKIGWDGRLEDCETAGYYLMVQPTPGQRELSVIPLDNWYTFSRTRLNATLSSAQAMKWFEKGTARAAKNSRERGQPDDSDNDFEDSSARELLDDSDVEINIRDEKEPEAPVGPDVLPPQLEKRAKNKSAKNKKNAPSTSTTTTNNNKTTTTNNNNNSSGSSSSSGSDDDDNDDGDGTSSVREDDIFDDEHGADMEHARSDDSDFEADDAEPKPESPKPTKPEKSTSGNQSSYSGHSSSDRDDSDQNSDSSSGKRKRRNTPKQPTTVENLLSPVVGPTFSSSPPAVQPIPLSMDMADTLNKKKKSGSSKRSGDELSASQANKKRRHTSTPSDLNASSPSPAPSPSPSPAPPTTEVADISEFVSAQLIKMLSSDGPLPMREILDRLKRETPKTQRHAVKAELKRKTPEMLQPAGGNPEEKLFMLKPQYAGRL